MHALNRVFLMKLKLIIYVILLKQEAFQMIRYMRSPKYLIAISLLNAFMRKITLHNKLK